MNVHIARRQFSLSSLLFVIAYAAVFSALLFYPPILKHPFSFATAFFLLGMFAILASLTRISDRTKRPAFLVKQTIRNLYGSLVLFVVIWISNSRTDDKLMWILEFVVIVALPDWIHLLLKRRMASGSRKDRLLEILDYVVITEEPQEGAAG